MFQPSSHQQNRTSQTLKSLITQNTKPPKWLKFYNPTVSINTTEYHFVSQPEPQKHQKVTVKVEDSSRPVTMYFEVEDFEQIRKHMIAKKQDKSGLKDFTYLDYIEKQEKIILNKQQTIRNSIWAKQYEPKAFYELLTDQLINRNVLSWLKSWDPIVFHRQAASITPTPKYIPKNPNPNSNSQTGKPFYNNLNEYNHTKLLLLSGPPGCGKTTLARVIAKHCGYEVAQLNASDDRSAKALITKIQALGKTNSITTGKPTMIVVDQVDGALQQDGNGIKQVLAYIQNGGKSQKEKEKPNKNQFHHKAPRPTDLPRTQPIHHQKHTALQRPIIFICNDPFVKGLRQLRSKAIVVYFRLVQKQRIVKRLKQITEKQKVYIENEVLIKIAEISNCDIRGSMSILEYVCQSKRLNNLNPKDVIDKLKLSFAKDSNTSIIQFVGSLLNQTKISSIKNNINIRQFMHTVSKIDNPQLLLETFFHNFIQYKNFLTKRSKEALKLYQFLQMSDVLMNQSFRYNNQLDSFVMMVFLYYRSIIINDEVRKTQFPMGFFERLNKRKQHKETVGQLVQKWPIFLKSITSNRVVIKEYLYVLYYGIQTSSTRDNQIVECVSKMITYGIQFAPRNAFFMFKPQFDALLTFGGKKLEVLYSNISRTLIEESYEFAKLKSHLLADLSLSEINKNTQQLMSQLNIKNKRRKRNAESAGNSSIKYKFIEGSGTQITYDLKFRFFFQ